MESNSVKLNQEMSGADYRRIWNGYAPRREMLRWIVCYILLVLSTRGILDINFKMGIMGFILLEIIVLEYLLRTPSKVKKNLASNWTKEVIFNNDGLVIGGMDVLYSNIKKVTSGQDFVIVNAGKTKFTFTFEGTELVSSFVEQLKHYCGHRTKFIQTETKKSTKRVVLGCGLAIYLFITISSICTVANYDKTVSKYAEKFSEIYDIELYILYGSDKTYEHNIDGVTSKYSVIYTLKTIDKMLERFPEDIFREIDLSLEGMTIKEEKLKLVISGEIDNPNKSDITTLGVTVSTDEGYTVYIDCTRNKIADTFAHEMCHVLVGAYEDYKADNLMGFFQAGKGWSGDDDEWTRYNPTEYIYYRERSAADEDGWTSDYVNTASEKDVEDIYFVTSYAKSALTEDMAETFKYLVSSDNSLPSFYESSYIQAKAKYLIQWLDEKYESVDEDVYWNKWFKE